MIYTPSTKTKRKVKRNVTQQNFKKNFHTVVDLFFENFMILNTNKCSYICIGNNVTDTDTLQSTSEHESG